MSFVKSSLYPDARVVWPNGSQCPPTHLPLRTAALALAAPRARPPAAWHNAVAMQISTPNALSILKLSRSSCPIVPSERKREAVAILKPHNTPFDFPATGSQWGRRTKKEKAWLPETGKTTHNPQELTGNSSHSCTGAFLMKANYDFTDKQWSDASVCFQMRLNVAQRGDRTNVRPPHIQTFGCGLTWWNIQKKNQTIGHENKRKPFLVLEFLLKRLSHMGQIGKWLPRSLCGCRFV